MSPVKLKKFLLCSVYFILDNRKVLFFHIRGGNTQNAAALLELMLIIMLLLAMLFLIGTYTASLKVSTCKKVHLYRPVYTLCVVRKCVETNL